MTASTRTRRRPQRAGVYRCPGGAHDYPRPIIGRRPVVVFCTRCQTAKDVT